MELTQEQKFKFRYRLEQEQAQSQPTSDLGFGNVEAKRKQPLPERPNPFTAGAEAVKSLNRKDLIPGNQGKSGMAALQVLGAPYLAAESVVARRALSGQEGLSKFMSPKQMAEDVYKGVTGPHVTIGDVNYRAGMNRASADIAGTVQNLAVQGPELIEGGYNALKNLPKTIASIPGAVGKVPVPFTGANLGEIWNAGKNIKPVEAELSKLAGLPSETAINAGTKKGLKVVDSARKSMVGEVETSAKSGQEDLLKNFKSKRAVIDSRMKEATQLEASDYKGAIKKIFSGPGGVTEKYGQGIVSAEDALLKQGTPLSPVEYGNDVLQKTLNEATARGIPPDDPSLTKLMETASKLSKADKFGIIEAKNIKNNIYGELSGGVRRGTEAISDNHDQVANIFLRNHGEFLGTKSPEMAKLNIEAAPMYEARRWAYKNFQPYRPNVIEKGASLLEKIAKGEKVKVDDVSFLRDLEKGSGRFAGTGSLRKASTTIGEEMNLSKATYDTSRQRLIDATDYHIQKIQESINQDVSTIKSGGNDQLDIVSKNKSRAVELGFKQKELERLRNTKYILLGLAAGSTVVGKKALGVVKALSS